MHVYPRLYFKLSPNRSRTGSALLLREMLDTIHCSGKLYGRAFLFYHSQSITRMSADGRSQPSPVVIPELSSS